MRFPFYCRSAIAPLLVVFSCAPLALQAQESGPPKILVVQREFPKPGKGGMLHEKTEAAYVRELDAAKASPHYVALNSLSGPSRAIFLSGYPSLEAWEQENKSVFENASLNAALDRANVADGDLLASTDASVWRLREDLSLLKPMDSMKGVRYMRISQYFIRPGHQHEWEELVKMVRDGLQKNVPEANWAMFEQVYGTNSNGFVVITPLKSMTEEDARFESDKSFAEGMGDEGMKKVDALAAMCIESEQSNLFLFDPKMSRAPESWVKDEPDFWRPRVAPVRKSSAAPKTETGTGR